MAARTRVECGLKASTEERFVGLEVLPALRVLLLFGRAQILPPDFACFFEAERPGPLHLRPPRTGPFAVSRQSHDDSPARPESLLKDVYLVMQTSLENCLVQRVSSRAARGFAAHAQQCGAERPRGQNSPASRHQETAYHAANHNSACYP